MRLILPAVMTGLLSESGLVMVCGECAQPERSGSGIRSAAAVTTKFADETIRS